jgi:hypothetical protein
MCRAPTTPRKVKAERTAHLSPKGESGRWILTIGQGKTATLYWLEALESDFGVAYRLTKWADESVTYDVNLCLADPRHSACCCLGFLRWGHLHPCRHIAALVALRSAGRLP